MMNGPHRRGREPDLAVIGLPNRFVGLAMLQLGQGPIRFSNLPWEFYPQTGHTLAEPEIELLCRRNAAPICRAILTALHELHRSDCCLNGQLYLDNVYIMPDGRNDYRAQFLAPYNPGLSPSKDVEARYRCRIEDGMYADVQAAGVLIRKMVDRNQMANTPHCVLGALVYLSQLSKWMTSHPIASSPSARCCVLHHAAWTRCQQFAFVGAVNEVVYQLAHSRNPADTDLLSKLFPTTAVRKLFISPTGAPHTDDWKINLQLHYPTVHSLLSGARGRGLQRWDRLSGRNLSHFLQAAHIWERHEDELNPDLRAIVSAESEEQGPLEYALGLYPLVLDSVVGRFVEYNMFERHYRLRQFLSHYPSECPSFVDHVWSDSVL